MKSVVLFSLLGLCTLAFGQSASDSFNLNQNSVYQRPFIQSSTSRTAVGGYLEGNTNYMYEDGVAEGFSMELRRFNIFLYSSISRNIKFLSELEFEHGTEEIALETAMLDFKLHQQIRFRAGIILPTIGIFNSNHDAPNWEFVERPISSTLIIPSTLSEVGFGIDGYFPTSKLMIGYQVFATNGLGDDIVQNSLGRTDLNSGKREQMFGEDNNGLPMYNAHISLSNYKGSEVGFSYYGGVYNTFQADGLDIDSKRKLSLWSLDFDVSIKKINVKGEYVWTSIDVPSPSLPMYGTKQQGGFVDLIYPVYQNKILRFSKAVVNASLRVEYFDLNDNLIGDGEVAGEQGSRISLGLGLRPVPGTLIRANYMWAQQNDILSNPMIRSGGYQIGVASYF